MASRPQQVEPPLQPRPHGSRVPVCFRSAACSFGARGQRGLARRHPRNAPIASPLGIYLFSEPSRWKRCCGGCPTARGDAPGRRTQDEDRHSEGAQEAERRSAATPDTVKRYAAMGLELVVEAGAGAGAAVADEAFTAAGAAIGDEAAVWAADIVLKVQRPTEAEMARLRQGQVLIGMLDPYNNKDQVQAYAKAGVIAFAMELLPRTTRAQAMDVLSSQANLAGYKAVVDAHGRVSAG